MSLLRIKELESQLDRRDAHIKKLMDCNYAIAKELEAEKTKNVYKNDVNSFTPADMATAAAQGFRDGVASVQAS